MSARFRLLAQHPRRSTLITISVVILRYKQRKFAAIPNRASQTEADLRDRTVREGESPEIRPENALAFPDRKMAGIQESNRWRLIQPMKVGFVSWSIRCSSLPRPIEKPVAVSLERERFWRVADNHLDLYIEITRSKFVE
jgi:hypothetical protein